MTKIGEAFRRVDALNDKACEAERKLAQWLIDHPQYSNQKVGEWLHCDDARVSELRRWALAGFVDADDNNETAHQ